MFDTLWYNANDFYKQSVDSHQIINLLCIIVRIKPFFALINRR